jgi:hypothetical protein
MKFRITITYNYYTTIDNETYIGKFYCLNDIPFTFDELPAISQDDPAIIALAEISYRYTAEQLYKYSNYLILEEVHPLLFELDLENPELVPVE